VTAEPVTGIVEHLFRTEAGRITALLVRILGVSRLSIAEDATQDALIAALHHWPRTGVPANPPAWLLQVARRKAIDALRRERSFHDRSGAIRAELEAATGRGPDDGEPLSDDQLALAFLCCHPALSAESRVALTLKLVGGFGAGEIARAFLADERAVAQRLLRAKRTLRAADAPFELPPAAELPARIDSVLEALYLMFNEGYAAHEGDALLRRDCCLEALRLAERLIPLAGRAAPKVHALAALFCFHLARFDARIDVHGAIVLLADQDRSSWSPAFVARGYRHFDESAQGDELTAYHLEAELAACHVAASSWEATDWDRILTVYDRLLELTGSPVVALSRIVAAREAGRSSGSIAEIDALRSVPALRHYLPFHWLRGDLLADLGRTTEAAAAFDAALELTRCEPVRGLLRERRKGLRADDVDC
jgi:RNA polymerase sigma-70 factor (ECF subfamily)